MIEFLLNNALWIIFIVAMSAIAYTQCKKFMASKNMDADDFKQFVEFKIIEIGAYLLRKISVAVILTLIISIVSFREFFTNDVFHIVFMTILLRKHVKSFIKSIFQ